MELGDMVLAIAGGLAGSVVGFFVFVRRLVTREEVEKMLQDRIAPMESRQTRTEELIEGLREDMQKLSENIVRLSTILEQLRP